MRRWLFEQWLQRALVLELRRHRLVDQFVILRQFKQFQ
jgi:hypothetical protein